MDVRDLFDPAAGSIYLDAATYGLPPRPTVEAMHAAVDAWQVGTADWVNDWDTRGEVCRARFAELLGGPADAVALVPSVSTGVGTVAATLQPGDQVLVPDDEFTSVLFPLLVAQRDRQVQVRQVPFEALAEHIQPSTRLVAFSLVQSHSGRVAPLAEIVAAARGVGARTLVDATHAVPFVPLAEQLPEIDYVVCAAYKHLLCPRGVAFLYVAPRQWDRVPPIMANWRSASNPYGHYYGGSLDLAPTAARFDISLAWFAWVGASVSLELLADWQRQGRLSQVVELARRLSHRLGLTPTGSSVVSVPVADAEAARAALDQAHIRAAVRAGNVRLSPHVYNTADEVDRVAACIEPFVRVVAHR